MIKYTLGIIKNNDNPTYTDWRDLACKCGLNASMTPEWINTSFAALATKPQVLEVFASLNEGLVTGLIPFYYTKTRMHGLPIKLIGLAGNYASYHQEIISLNQHSEILNALLLKKQEWQVFQAENVPNNGPTANALRSIAKTYGHTLLEYPGDASPYIEVNHHSFEEYLSTKTKKFRYNRKKEVKDFHKKGLSENKWYTEESSIDELLRLIFQIEEKSWKINEDMSITQNTNEIELYKHLIPTLAYNKTLLANVLFLNGSPIAYNLCYFWNNRIGQIKTSFNDEFKHLSPGSVVLFHLLEKAFELQAKEFDFLGDIMPHKMKWTNTTRQQTSFYMYSKKHITSSIIGKIKQLRHTRKQSHR